MNRKINKLFITFIVFCVITIGFILFSALTYALRKAEAAPPEAVSQSSDENSAASSENYDWVSGDPKEGVFTGRTLSEYYSRRQYPGSPPEIPHPVEVHGVKLACLTCHADGGWSERRKAMTPLTPHPEQVSCRQCHVSLTTDALFRAIDWQSVPPPRLGGSYLPGAPSPIPHDLQMRGNCIACHVGPGTVTAIRVEHPSRGNCRQCHVPDPYTEPFQRKSED